jgi:ribonuclease D
LPTPYNGCLPEYIDTPATLSSTLDALRPHSVIACDTESDAYFAYNPKVCLIQISVPGQDFLVDALADIDFASLGALLGEADRTVIFHAAENDVIQLYHQFDWRMPGLFDTQVACFVLGLPPYSLAGVLEARFEVKLDKSQQRSDWAERPLSDKQLEYAADDTRYLIDLRAELIAKAEEAGRMEEIASECSRIAAREWAPVEFDPDSFHKIKASKTLDPWGLRILRSLYVMRHEEADQKNRPAYRIANDSLIVEIAEKKLTGSVQGRAQGFWRRFGKRVAGIVRAEENNPPLPPKKRVASKHAPDSPAVKECYERLRKWRGRAAEERGVESWVVSRNEMLMTIARAEPETATDLEALIEAFRFREYGEAMMDAIQNPNR